MLCISEVSKEYTHILARNFLNIQWIFIFQKSFGKWRLRAFQPYHEMLCMLEVSKVAQNK